MIDEKKVEEAAQGAADLYEQDLPVMSYNDDTAHLIGTTDDWKGGEG